MVSALVCVLALVVVFWLLVVARVAQFCLPKAIGRFDVIESSQIAKEVTVRCFHSSIDYDNRA